MASKLIQLDISRMYVNPEFIRSLRTGSIVIVQENLFQEYNGKLRVLLRLTETKIKRVENLVIETESGHCLNYTCNRRRYAKWSDFILLSPVEFKEIQANPFAPLLDIVKSI